MYFIFILHFSKTSFPIVTAENKNSHQLMAALCDNAGIRTQDPRLKRAMLYQLSYIVLRFFEGAKILTLF
jgi:hypothetical protein